MLPDIRFAGQCNKVYSILLMSPSWPVSYSNLVAGTIGMVAPGQKAGGSLFYTRLFFASLLWRRYRMSPHVEHFLAANMILSIFALSPVSSWHIHSETKTYIPIHFYIIIKNHSMLSLTKNCLLVKMSTVS